ncbi:MAG: peptidylprolyl isomerase [Verrucomicrobiota bacterium]
MFAGFRQHQKWIWLAVIAVVIPSFVIFFSPDRYFSRNGGKEKGLKINNRDVTYDEYRDVMHEAKLRFFFRFGQWPDRSETARQFGWDDYNEANSRLFMLEKVREMNIHANPETLVELAESHLEALGARGMNPKAALDEFERVILKPNGLNKTDYERFLRNEVRILHLVAVAGTAGRLIPPEEAKTLYRRENEEVVTELVHFAATNYLEKVPMAAPDKLKEFYTNHMAEYRLNDRVQLAYVKFEVTNFMVEAEEQFNKLTNKDAIVESIYMKRGTNFYRENGQALDPDVAKVRIRKEIKDEQAMNAARKKAYDLATKLSEKADSGAKLKIEDLAQMAAADPFKLTLKTSAPFDREDGPADMKVLAKFTDVAFALAPEEPVNLNPIMGDDGVFLIALKAKFPSEVPPFEAVLAKVTKDYQQTEALAQARSYGRIFYNTLTNGLGQHKTFTEICLSGKQKPLILPAFSRSTRSVELLPQALNLNDIKRIAFSLTPKTASVFLPTYDGGIILYLRERILVDETKLMAELPKFSAGLRQSRQFEVANEWLGRQRQGMQSDLPEPRKDEQQPQRRR